MAALESLFGLLCVIVGPLAGLVEALTGPLIGIVSGLLQSLVGLGLGGGAGSLLLGVLLAIIGLKWLKAHVLWIVLIFSMPYWAPAVC